MWGMMTIRHRRHWLKNAIEKQFYPRFIWYDWFSILENTICSITVSYGKAKGRITIKGIVHPNYKKKNLLCWATQSIWDNLGRRDAWQIANIGTMTCIEFVPQLLKHLKYIYMSLGYKTV